VAGNSEAAELSAQIRQRLIGLGLIAPAPLAVLADGGHRRWRGRVHLPHLRSWRGRVHLPITQRPVSMCCCQDHRRTPRTAASGARRGPRRSFAVGGFASSAGVRCWPGVLRRVHRGPLGAGVFRRGGGPSGCR
jgi:hypothetical protein